MTAFLVRNIGQRLILLVFISIIAHSVVHLAPGDPSLVDPMNPRMKPEDIARIRAAFHLDDPLHLQYAYWMRDLFTGQLKSFKDNQPVLEKLWERFLNSLPLFLVTTLITWCVAFPFGVQAAVNRGSMLDKGGTLLAYTLISFPGFFLAYICIIFMVKVFDIPVIGMRTFGLEDAGLWFQSMDRIWHLT
ncbi:MAG: ABC transporter permease, partial [Nitrospinae bacterium]|nr:ABC transporter permease [Nitrospinota bacterium]